jgi:hypothetical protein
MELIIMGYGRSVLKMDTEHYIILIRHSTKESLEMISLMDLGKKLSKMVPSIQDNFFKVSLMVKEDSNGLMVVNTKDNGRIMKLEDLEQKN